MTTSKDLMRTYRTRHPKQKPRRVPGFCAARELAAARLRQVDAIYEQRYQRCDSQWRPSLLRRWSAEREQWRKRKDS